MEQGVTKRCRLSWLTKSGLAKLAYEPKCGGAVGGGGRRVATCRVSVSANEYSLAHEAHINFGDLTPYLTNALNPLQIVQ